jgi:hypothetical protein
LVILLTDLKDASNTFSLLEDIPQVSAEFKIKTARLLDYSGLFDEKSGKTLNLNEVHDPSNKNVSLDHTYYLKY